MTGSERATLLCVDCLAYDGGNKHTDERTHSERSDDANIISFVSSSAPR